MKADNILRVEAMDALIKTLGELDAERFIHLIKSECFDYTKWRHHIFEGKSLDEIYDAAAKNEKQNRSNAV